MVKKTTVLKAPYAPDGSLLHFPGGYRPFSHYEDTKTGERLEHDQIWGIVLLPEKEPRMYFTGMKRQIHHSWKSVHLEPEWRDNVPFSATLQLDHVRSGRSAKYVILTAVNDLLDTRIFPMFVTDLLDTAIAQGITVGGIMDGRWMVAKRGQNYGLRLAHDHE
jgi:hypothetical protein